MYTALNGDEISHLVTRFKQMLFKKEMSYQKTPCGTPQKFFSWVGSAFWGGRGVAHMLGIFAKFLPDAWDGWDNAWDHKIASKHTNLLTCILRVAY